MNTKIYFTGGVVVAITGVLGLVAGLGQWGWRTPEPVDASPFDRAVATSEGAPVAGESAVIAQREPESYRPRVGGDTVSSVPSERHEPTEGEGVAAPGSETDANAAVERALTEVMQFVDRMPSGDVQAEAMTEAVRQAAGQDPEFTARWLEAVPAGEFRRLGQAALARQWAEVDPVGAEAWISGLPPEDRTSDLLGSMAEGVATLDPDAGQAWAESIEDDESRQLAVLRVLAVADDPARVVATLVPDFPGNLPPGEAGQFEGEIPAAPEAR